MSCHSKTAFFFKPAEVQSGTKFLNGVICGLSDRSGSEEAERSHRSEALRGAQERRTKLSGAMHRSEATKLSEPEERSDKVERSANARATPGWTASIL